MNSEEQAAAVEGILAGKQQCRKCKQWVHKFLGGRKGLGPVLCWKCYRQGYDYDE